MSHTHLENVSIERRKIEYSLLVWHTEKLKINLIELTRLKLNGKFTHTQRHLFRAPCYENK